MSRANQPAMPTVWQNNGDLNVSAPNGDVVPPEGFVHLHGLTIREQFAAMAMQGMAANRTVTDIGSASGVAKTAVEMADALIAELARDAK